MSEKFVIFARFHAIEGQERPLVAELKAAVARVSVQPGSTFAEAYSSLRDPRLFWVHSRWVDEAAFDVYAALPATQAFVGRTQRLIDHPFDVTRAQALPEQV
jgi:quinol monooxygenase YgiN